MQANGIEGQPRLYSNSLDCLQRVVSQEGVTGMQLYLKHALFECTQVYSADAWQTLFVPFLGRPFSSGQISRNRALAALTCLFIAGASSLSGPVLV